MRIRFIHENYMIRRAQVLPVRRQCAGLVTHALWSALRLMLSSSTRSDRRLGRTDGCAHDRLSFPPGERHSLGSLYKTARLFRPQEIQTAEAVCAACPLCSPEPLSYLVL